MAVLFRCLRRAALFVSLAAALMLAYIPVKLMAAELGEPIARYASALRSFNPHLSLTQSRDMATHVLLLSSYYDLDPRLLIAIVGVESGWRSAAVSPAGAQGLGQLMPATAGVLGVLAFDAYENLDGTARYLRRMLQQFPGLSPEARVVRALASYNAGPAAVARAGGVPAIPETRTYVARVTGLWHRLQQELPSGAVAPPAPRVARIAVRATPKPRVTVEPRDADPPGSVAEFMSLEVASLAMLPAPTAAPVIARTPLPAKERRGLGRWVARAFGSR